MRFAFVILTALFASSAFANAPSAETAQVVRALVNSPDIVKQIKGNNSDKLDDVQITEVKPGVIQYNLTFSRSCFCIPSTAEVSIQEDLTPTYADGPAIYTSSITIK